ncbi:MAG: PHP domain-containing protein [Deltaproteobacteria bacterium]|nr:PHP domain-containing protein [Deltaproteobacteria bacterium]
MADLHIHSALSPCAQEEMSPPAIVEAAREAGLDLIAVCDHNSAANAAAVQRAAGEWPHVIAGMEICSAEEVHVVALFADATRAERAAAEVLETLPRGRAAPTSFGRQLLMDASGAVLGEELRLLGTACAFDLKSTVQLIHRFNGLAIAAHVNRPSFSVFSQLGGFPSGAGFDAVELAAVRVDPPWQAEIDGLDLPVLRSSDSHYLEQIGSFASELSMRCPSFEGLRELVCRQRGG